jgi:lipopolysaccharide/colanic/teichoic acid biosynthesis glycosyltransferase
VYQRYFKRLFDFGAAFVLLLFFASAMLVIALLLAWANRGQVFFVQPRPGYGAKPFRLVKFRTMREAYDEVGQPLPDTARLTPTGRFLRTYSLDELPQLWNVLKGDLSLVGPRPLLLEYLPLYSAEQAQRHCIRPGLTGWAQINGRNATSWAQRFEHDLWYVHHISWQLDLCILSKTLEKVLRSEGVYAGQGLTMEKFQGNSSLSTPQQSSYKPL